MKPKTKIQVRIMGLSNKLPKLKSIHEKWAEKIHDKYVTKHYSKLCCLECGHSWKDELPNWTLEVVKHTCSECKSELTVIKKGHSLSKYETFAITDVVEEFQVIRYFTVWKHMEKLKSPIYFFKELFQEFDDFQLGVNKKTKVTVVGLNFTSYSSWRDDGFNYGSNFDIKDPFGYNNSYYRYTIGLSAIYPKVKVLPEIERNGFENDFHFVDPRKLFKSILSNPISETLIKLKNTELLSYYISKDSSGIDKYWNQIKTCFRNGYQIKDVSMWIDYINFLAYFKKDINNPKFICPDDLRAAHNEYLLKKRAELERLDYIANLEQRKEEEADKAKNLVVSRTKKKCFQDFTLNDNEIKYVVLFKAKDFKKEGQILDHCVYESDYHKKAYSLIMSARINDLPIETIEIDLMEFSLIQARGYDNEPSEKHDRIVNFLEKNLSKIKRIFQKELDIALNPKKKENVKSKLKKGNQQLPVAV